MKLSRIVKILDLKIDIKNDIEIKSINSLLNAKFDEISYCDGVKNQDDIAQTNAGAVLISENLAYLVGKNTQALVCENPHLAFAILSKEFSNPIFYTKSSSFIDESANIMPNVHIGSNSKIGKSIVMHGAYIGDNVIIGDDCIIHPNVVIYNNTIIGNSCHILANAVIGSDGFGYAHKKDGSHVKIYHNGNVILEDEVEIGAGTTIDRAVFGSTIIKKCTKIDNLVQIGHNCELGENCIIVSQTGLAGSTILGRNVVMGGQSGSVGHVKVGDFAQIAARAGVSKNLEGFKKYAGHPIFELNEWLRLNAKITRFFKKQ